MRGPVLETYDSEPPHGHVGVSRGALVQERPERVDVAGMGPRETFERDQRRPAGGRALVLEPAPEQLELLAEAELRDRAVGLRANAVVHVAGRMLDLFVPLHAEGRERALVTGLGKRVRLGRGVPEAHSSSASVRAPGPT